jgi:hypothetical protein
MSTELLEAAFDPVLVAEIVEQHGYMLVPQKTGPLEIATNVCILLLVLFMLFQLRIHINNLLRLRKRKLQ